MSKSVFAFVFVALVFLFSPHQAIALDDELKIGRAIFVQMCSNCHGMEGDGDGEIADLFKVKPRALSQLSKDNGGEYPFDLVYRTLKATSKVKGHGDTAMPIWGDFFMAEEILNDPSIDEKESFIILGKMLSVIYYIETLQEE